MTNPPRITPESLPLLEWLDAIACVVRDESMKLVWCNTTYARFSKRPREKLLGSHMSDFIPLDCAKEREDAYRRSLEHNIPLSFIQLGAGERLYCQIAPIDPEAFGHRGVLITIQEAPNAEQIEPPKYDMVLQSACPDELEVLTPVEMRLLYYMAQGLTTKEIASTVHRSTKTIDNQITSIHSKIGATSRAQAVKFAVDRGIHRFTPEQWEHIISRKSGAGVDTMMP